MPSVLITGNFIKNGIKQNFSWNYPSTIVLEFLKKGKYANDKKFINKAIKAIIEANKRVFKKYGFYCTASIELKNEIKKLKKYKLKNIEITKIE